MKFVLVALLITTLGSIQVTSQTLGGDNIKQKLENGITDFTVKLNELFHKNSGPEENVLFSPINIYAALALTHLAADGDTLNEISTVLGLPSSKEELQPVHENVGKLMKRIQNSRKTEIIIADSIFVQTGTPFKVAYLNQASSYYKADIATVNFKDHESNATEIINRWISHKTKGRIPSLFTVPLPLDTMILIASSLYFSGSWQNQFPQHLTAVEKFNTGVKEIEIPMMTHKKDVPYSNNPSLQYEAINLKYYGNELSMFFVLPYANQTLKNLTQHLTSDQLRNLINETTEDSMNVHYKIPQFKFKSQRKINDYLSALGLKSLFEHAKLTNMITNVDVKVSEVVHAAEIEIHEKGTIATAVTTLSFVPLSLPVPLSETIPFYLNRPFMFFIYHFDTKTILFSGLIYKPVEIEKPRSPLPYPKHQSPYYNRRTPYRSSYA